MADHPAYSERTLTFPAVAEKHMKFAPALTALIFATSLHAELSLPNFFSDHMVLQRDKPAAIWGTANPGAKVTLNFAGQDAGTKADGKGAWKITLQPLKTNAKGQKLTVKAGRETKTINDVLVGEVWFASGQSNMAMPVTNTHQAKEDIAAANLPGIRMFLADLNPSATPQANIGGAWNVCTPETVSKFSATAYFFAAALHRELKVPIGIIRSAWGGKPVETFTSREALASIPEGKVQVDALDKAAAGYDPEKAKKQHKAALEKWEKALAAWKAKPADKRGRPPRKPPIPRNPAATEGKPASLYNGMIHPFVGYTMRGAIWYQGEANAKSPETSAAYGKLFPLMIDDWRKRWNDEFSFMWVQLANFRKPATEPGTVDHWAHLQDEQRKTLSLKKTGMATINDIGDANNIHPKNKKEVGERLARWSLAADYEKDIARSGPLFKSHKIEGNKVRISFTDTASGLKARDNGPLKRFEIAGADKKWHWAEAKIDGDSVIVSCPDVPKPAAVRYAWCSNPEGANIVNSEGLPASNFRTDNW